MNEKIKAQILNDRVYGPNSPFFWPGTVSHAKDFVLYDQSIDCRSTKEFLENYEDDYSGVAVYIANTEYPDKEYIDELYAHFHKLYDGIEAWPYHTFFVSAFYRIVFHEIFPYQSKRYDLAKSSEFNILDKAYLSKGLYDEAIRREFLQSVEKTQQDKAIDKVGGRISDSTWYHLIRILRDPETDSLVYQEVIRLVEQYNLIDTNPEGFKKKMLFRLEVLFSSGRVLEPSNRKAFTDNYLVCLSLLRIPTEKGHQAIQKSLAEKSYAPLIAFLQTDESTDES